MKKLTPTNTLWDSCHKQLSLVRLYLGSKCSQVSMPNMRELKNDYGGVLSMSKFEDKEISCVGDLFSILGEMQIKPFGSLNVSATTFYRGQSNYDWELIPSLFRNDLYGKETYMIKKIKHLAVEELDWLDRFSQLVKLQHYGLPTRLLDLTENPLVALYFACRNRQNDGAFYIFKNYPTHWSDDPLVETFMDFIFEIGFNHIDVENYLDICKSKYKGKYYSRRPISSESELIGDLSTYFAVYPQRNNSRLFEQQGAFLLFGSNLVEVKVSNNLGTYGKRYLLFDSNIKNKIPSNIVKIKVRESAKNLIINELNILGVNKMKLFPELDSLISNVVEETRNEL